MLQTAGLAAGLQGREEAFSHGTPAETAGAFVFREKEAALLYTPQFLKLQGRLAAS